MKTHHETTLAHGTGLHRHRVGGAGIGGFKGFDFVFAVGHDLVRLWCGDDRRAIARGVDSARRVPRACVVEFVVWCI